MSSGLRCAFIVAVSLFMVAGCASSQQKMRREQRERAVQNTHLYCEFINGEQYPDMDVALNLAMAQKCDADGSLTITAYKTPSEIPGMMFCCSVRAHLGHEGGANHNERMKRPEPRSENKSEPKAAELKPVPTPVPAATPAPSTATVEAKNYPPPEVPPENTAPTEPKVDNKADVKTDAKKNPADDELGK